MKNIYIHTTFAVFCVTFLSRACCIKTPSEQPDCRYNTKADDFYRAHAPSKKDKGEPKTNWICEQTYKSKLKICVGMYRLMVNRKFDTAYEIANEKDKESVNTECEKHAVTFYRQILEEDDDVGDGGLVTLDIDMFKCPISKLDIKFKFSWKIFPPKRYDFWVTQGYGPGTVALMNDSPNKLNICVTNMFRPKSKS